MQQHLSVPDVANELGLKTATIRALIGSGTLRAFRIRRRYRIRREWLDDFIAAGDVGAPGPRGHGTCAPANILAPVAAEHVTAL